MIDEDLFQDSQKHRIGVAYLPLFAMSSKLRMLTLAIPFSIFLGGVGGLGLWFLLSEAKTFLIGPNAAFIISIVFPTLLLLLLMGCGMAHACVKDVFQFSPVLILDDAGLCGLRTGGEFIAWGDIRRATVYRTRVGQVAGVRMLLRRPVERRPHPFYPGLLWVFWTYRADVHLPLMLLDKDAEVLGRIVVFLVRQHGGYAGNQRKDEDLIRLSRILAWRLGRLRSR